MKNIIRIIFIVLFITVFAYPQSQKQSSFLVASASTAVNNSTADSINIRQKVLAQIDSAKNRELRGEILSNFYSWNTNAGSQVTGSTIEKKLKQMGSSLQVKVVIIFALAGLLFLIVVIRRMILNLIRYKDRDRTKVQFSERLKTIPNNQFLLMGDKLKKTARVMNDEAVSDTAKELALSKGELILASKLRSYELFKLGINNNLRDNYD